MSVPTPLFLFLEEVGVGDTGGKVGQLLYLVGIVWNHSERKHSIGMEYGFKLILYSIFNLVKEFYYAYFGLKLI